MHACYLFDVVCDAVCVQTPHFSERDVQDVEKQCKGMDNFRGVDILLTSDWPKDVCRHTHPPVCSNSSSSRSNSRC